MEMDASDEASDQMEEGALDSSDAPSAEFPEEMDAGESEEASENRPAPSSGSSAAGPITEPTRRNSTRSSRPKTYAIPMN